MSQFQVRELLQDGSTVVNARDGENNTALHVMCEHDQPHNHDLLMLLLQSKADVNAGGHFQETPLHKASYNGCLQCVEALIR